MKVFDQIELNPPHRPAWLYWVIAATLVSLSLGLGADALRRHSIRLEWEEQQAERVFQAQLAIQKQALQQEREERRLHELDEAVKPWLHVASFPWDDLMLSLERLSLPGLRVVSLAVDARQGVAKLGIGCSDAGQAAEVVRLLDEGRPPDDRRWHLMRVQSNPLPSGVDAEIRYHANAPN